MNANSNNHCIRYAEIALNLPKGDLFIYEIPKELSNKIQIGSRVIVPFRNKQKIGIIMGFKEKTLFENTRQILKLLEPYPILDAELIQLTRWVADYYLAPLGESVHAAVPPKSGIRDAQSHLFQEMKELYTQIDFILPESLIPTSEQQNALNSIYHHLSEKKFQVLLLYGVTGSGKTEIYLQSIARTLELKKNALILVPEIALTYQLIQRFRERFNDKIAVLHSGLSLRDRIRFWRRIRFGEARVIIGVRSAVFSPVRQLGLIIIDEEHESTFKQDNSPRYNARDVAIMRGKFNNATVILGSATPSLESYYHAQSGKYGLLELSKRIDNRLMPVAKIIDMRQEWDLPEGNQIISSRLQYAISDRLNKKEQILLFLNRRGFATVLLCRACGNPVFCKRCSVPLTFHRVTNKAHCHYCGLQYNAPEKCPVCTDKLIRYLGCGTQQVETELIKLYPQAKISRLDMDIAKKRGQYELILENYITGKTDILIGTQMIAKGMDIANVTLVGVIDADLQLNLSDFRSAERAYAILTQVAGRSGRGNKPGEVFIQTYNPSHYSLQSAVKNQAHEFYKQELKNRKKIFFPPYCRILLILIQHRSDKHALSIAKHLAYIAREKIKEDNFHNIDILGPAIAPKLKLKNKYRYHLIFKSPQPTKIRELYQYTLTELPKQVKLSGIQIIPDMNPLLIF